jgi:hypothetical protein
MMMSQYYPPNQTAAGTRLFEFVKQLSREDAIEQIDIIVWHPTFPNKDEPAPFISKVTVHDTDFRKIKGSKILKYQDPNPFYALIWLFLTIKYIRRLKPDMVFFSTPPGIMVTPALWCSLTGIRYMLEYRDNWIDINRTLINQRNGPVKSIAMSLHNLFRLIATFVNRKAALIPTVNSEITDSLGINPDLAIEVRNGIDRQEIEHTRPEFIHSSKGSRKYIAYVGNLSTPYYSPEVLIPVIEKIPHFHLVVFSPSISRNFSIAVEKANLKERVTVMEVEHERMLSILKGCDAGFLALKKDDPQGPFAVPSKFYDYAGCGLPVLVIADDSSFVHKFVKKHGNGIALAWAEENDKDKAIRDINARNIVPMVLDEFDRGRANQTLVERILKLEKLN